MILLSILIYILVKGDFSKNMLLYMAAKICLKFRSEGIQMDRDDRSRNGNRVLMTALVTMTMIIGSLAVFAGTAEAQPEDAIFTGNVTVDGTPSNETLVMYGLTVDEFPAQNSTVTDLLGDYEIWVTGGDTYDLYFANGAAMFDQDAMNEGNYINPSETIVIDADLNPAPPRTVTIKGYINNVSNTSEPVTTGHVLGLHMDLMMGGDGPDYINWTVTNSSGYYEMDMLSGALGIAVFDAPGYLPGMTNFETDMLMLSDGESGWLNLSLIPVSAANVTITGTVTDSSTAMPIAGANVRIEMQEVMYFDSNTTNASGGYELNTFRGTGDMIVTATGYSSLMEENIPIPGNMTKDFQLYSNNARVYGYILDEYTLNPIPNASVEARNWLMPNVQLFNDTMSASDGYYEMNLSDGGWDISAGARGYGWNGTWTWLNPSDDMRLDIHLTPEDAMIKGYVLDANTSMPIEDATVRIQGSFDDNMTFTNDSGYYEINCLADDYEIQFFADGYMGEILIGDPIEVGPGETVWVNHSLLPAETEVYGLVTDSVTSAPIGNVEIMMADFIPGSDYVRIAVTQSRPDGNYSAMVYPDSSMLFMGYRDGYRDYSETVNVTPLPSFEHNFSMIPWSAPNYTLIGYVNDSMTMMPIAWANVEAYVGMQWVNSTNANATGYYEMQLPIGTLDVTASNWGYIPKTDSVAPGAPGARVWHNFTLDSHSVWPIVEAYAIPDTNVSMINDADLYANITEDYLSDVQLLICAALGSNGTHAWLYQLEFNWFSTDSPWSDMEGTETAPGVWEVGLWDWLPEADDDEDLVVIKDANGSAIITPDFWYDSWMDEYWVWGQYDNSSLMGPIGANALFDGSGSLIGIDYGMGPDWWAASDPTGTFWMDLWVMEYNLTDNWIERMVSNASDTLETSSMYIENGGEPATYISGDYAVLFYVTDLAWLTTMNASLFTIDNDPPVADAGANQTEFVNMIVTLNGTRSNDNVGIANYTWTFQDGALNITLYGDIVQYTFTAIGNYTITLTVRDGANWIDSDTTYVDVVIDDVPPVADAGPDQTVDEDTLVIFNGTGSYDNNVKMGIVNYTWSFTDGSLQTLYDVMPSYTFSEPGSYQVTLVVTDFASLTDTDTVNITVVDVTPPVADAGMPQSTYENVTVTLNGTNSTDNVGIVNYTWTFIDGGLVTLYGSEPTYVFSNPGSYNITLNVSDAEGYWDTDNVTVTVLPDSTPPIADAGPDQTSDTETIVVLDGSNSTDNSGIIANYTWTFDDGGVQTLYGVSPSYTFTTPGIYNITLNVSDSNGNWATDTVNITVDDATPPIPNAGPDQTVDEDTIVVFDGSGSSDNSGTIANYTWTFDDGGPQTLYGVSPNYNFSDPGTYDITLNVSDSDGNWATDTVQITVVDVTPPTADAGPDQTVDVDTQVTFDGSGSTDNVGIVNYTWTFTDGTAKTLYGISPTYTFTNTGTYNVTLKVTDAEGLNDTDVVEITVGEAAEEDTTDPIADAGDNIEAIVGETVTFDGSGSTDNVGIVNYTWTLEVDGDTETLYGLSPSYEFEEAGTYVVTLTVRDAAGNTDTDTVTVTVNEAEEGGLTSALEDYWWLIVIVVVIIGALVGAWMMKGRKGGAKPQTPAEETSKPSKEGQPATEPDEEVPPPPPED